MDNIISFITKNKSYVLSFLGLSLLALIKRYSNGPTAKKRDLSGKVIIVTGASDGIGKITAEELLKQNATVVYACRNEEKTLKVINSLDKKYQENAIFIHLDLSSFSSIKKFVFDYKLKFNRLDILVNNAGIWSVEYQTTEDGIESTFQVNTFGPMVLTQELLGLLNKSSGKIVNVASKAHTRFAFNKEIIENTWSQESWKFYKNDYGFYRQYCFSKLGNVYFNQYLHEYITANKLNIKTVALHPGVIHTEIAKDATKIKLIGFLLYPIFWLLTKSLYKGAQTTLHCCYEDEALKSGEYYRDCGEFPVHPHASWSQKENRYAYIELSRLVINNYGEKAGVKFTLSLD